MWQLFLGYNKGMGFFNAFKNIVLGKPVFEAPGQNQAQPTVTHQGSGPKVIPQMYIERVNCQTSGDDMEVEVVVQNYSQQELVLDKITLLGQTQFLNSKSVSPGEEDDISAFDGDRPKNTHDSQCLLYYKNEEGDYFCTAHLVEFEKLPDNTFKVRNIRFSQVRDI